MSTVRLAVAALVAFPSILSAQTVFNGLQLNPNPGNCNTCAEVIAPAGAALSARNGFFSGLTNNVVVQNFDGLPINAQNPTLDFGFAGSATPTGGASVRNDAWWQSSGFPSGVTGFGYFPTSGSNYLLAQAGGVGAVGSVGITFNQHVAAFGFYGIDIGDVGGSLSLNVFDGSNLLGNYSVHSVTSDLTGLNGSIRFFGLTFDSNTFNRVEFVLTGGVSEFDGFLFDEMVVADARDVVGVPEPGTLALSLLGLMSLAAAARRRRVA